MKGPLYSLLRLPIKNFSFACKGLLAIEIFKTKMNIYPEITNKIFNFSKNSVYEWRRRGVCLSKSISHSTPFGIESIINVATKIWNEIPTKMKEASSKVSKQTTLKLIKQFLVLNILQITHTGNIKW